MKVRIVQRTIQQLGPPERGTLVTWDTEIAGFGVRITSTGVIGFVLDYPLNGRKRRFTIGRPSGVECNGGAGISFGPGFSLAWCCS